MNVSYSLLHSNDESTRTCDNIHLLAIEICKAEYFQACELIKCSQYMEEMLGNVTIGNEIGMSL